MMTKTGSPPSGEELAALQEQLAESRAEVERLQAGAADAEARAATAIGEAGSLREQLDRSQESRESAESDAQSARAYLDAAEARLRAAAGKFRDLVVRTEPELPAELIAGDDVDAVEASVAAAREIVGRVRSHIETEARATRVPAGAPPRSASDLSALPPEQKIRIGLERRAT
jgi:chromosome segregation ATPase